MKTIELQCSLVEPKAEDGAGWAFTAAGSFNGHGEVWRLIVSVAEKTIWHWGFF